MPANRLAEPTPRQQPTLTPAVSDEHAANFNNHQDSEASREGDGQVNPAADDLDEGMFRWEKFLQELADERE